MFILIYLKDSVSIYFTMLSGLDNQGIIKEKHTLNGSNTFITIFHNILYDLKTLYITHNYLSTFHILLIYNLTLIYFLIPSS